MTHNIPLIARASHSLSTILPVPDCGETTTGHTEHLCDRRQTIFLVILNVSARCRRGIPPGWLTATMIP